MTNLTYYAHLEKFGDPAWKEEYSDYLDRYHAWMIKKGYYPTK